jgi:PKD repeat protein
VGPLSVNVIASQTNLLVNRFGSFSGMFSGQASSVTWAFGDGQVLSNPGVTVAHEWTNAGTYTVTFTAFNNDNPAGVANNISIFVQPLNPPQLQAGVLLTNGFEFQFAGQTNANYTIQYATNLVPPVAWQTWQTIYSSSGGLQQITDTNTVPGTKFYRVTVQ